ncbi:MAG TPA: CBS domain-containing protein, partial [Candidatus Acidoferrum sp.]|nr:CBS domain-containing protein [Candidatus Acidoferrum sp.]
MKFEQLDTIVLVDSEARFSGTVPIVRMMLADDEQPMKELKAEPLLSVGPAAGGKEVFALFDKYNLRTLTVIDEENRPMGIITVDDVVSQLMSR